MCIARTESSKSTGQDFKKACQELKNPVNGNAYLTNIGSERLQVPQCIPNDPQNSFSSGDLGALQSSAELCSCAAWGPEAGPILRARLGLFTVIVLLTALPCFCAAPEDAKIVRTMSTMHQRTHRIRFCVNAVEAFARTCCHTLPHNP